MSGRTTAAAIGLLGAIGCAVASDLSSQGLVLGGALLALSVLGLVPMPYPARAAAVVTLAAAGLGLASLQQLEYSSGLSPVGLSVSVTVLALALFFRSWHRASLLSRALVALGITLCVGWMWLARALASLTILQADWQAFLPPLLQVPFALLLMLSLLAFMDSRSTGGCSAWAALLLAWYAVHSWSTLAIAYWPAGASHPATGQVGSGVAVGYFSAPLFATLLSLGLAQLLAVANSFERD